MTEKPITGCECPLAGYCPRHKIKKNSHFHHLCKTRQDYFDMYEKCIGPGQEFTNCQGEATPPTILVDGPTEPCPSCNKEIKPYIPPEPTRPQVVNNEPKMPSLWQQAKNFTKSVVEHAKTGAANVTPEEKQARLDICNSCEFYNKEAGRCGKCGCFLPVKCGWASSSCPIGLWGPGKPTR